MFAATSEERSHDATSQTCGKEQSFRPNPKVKKKAHSPTVNISSGYQVTLPPLHPEPRCFSAASMGRSLFSRASIRQSLQSDSPLSVVELPRLIAEVGAKKAIALGTDIPVKTAQSFTEKDGVTTSKNKKITAEKDGKATKANNLPLTGAEVVQLFVKKRDLGELELYYLKEVESDSYRPYDLQVVHSSEAGSEHYIFSPNTVLHVTERGYGGLVSLARWYRESVLWTALKEITFFREFKMWKTFTWWHRNVRKILFHRKRDKLQGTLLIAVPQFRNALILFSRVIEELKGAHLLPQDGSQTYTLLEFKDVLITNNDECLQILEKLSQYRAVILNAVKEHCFKAYQELQLHVEYAKKPNKCYEPIHLQMVHQQDLKKELSQAESTLGKLGNFAALINQMIVQSLITIIRQHVMAFLNNVLKREKSLQGCLFQTELCFSASGQLALDPPMHQFQEAVNEALLTVGNSIIQVIYTFPQFNDVFNSGLARDSKPDFSCIEHPTVTGENKDNDGMPVHRKFCCWRMLREQSAHSLVLPKLTLIMGQGNRMQGCYYPLSKEQLVWHISINDVSKQVQREQTDIMQEAQSEIQQLSERYRWLVDIHLFISLWSRASLESMKSALLYEENIKKVRLWCERLHTVPSSVSTSNQLFIIHCTQVIENLGQQLSFIEEEVQEHLVKQIKLHSEKLVSDLERATAELKKEPQDLHDLSTYALMLRESVKSLPDMEKRLEYIHSLQDVCMNYRMMTEQEQSLEEKMLGLWDCLFPLMKQADSIVCHRLPSMASAVDTMFSFLVLDLKNMVSNGNFGEFLDPTNNADEMVSKLNYMCAHVHTLKTKLEKLSMNSENLQENPMDLTVLTTDVHKIESRKELWELKALYTTWIKDWKKLLFTEVVVSQAQEKIARWQEQAVSLTSTIPSHDAVLQEALGNLESLMHQLVVMAKLQSPTLKHKHWKAIFQGMDLLYVAEKKVTVAELMSQQLDVHHKLINKICRDAQAECDMEQGFQRLQQGWKARLFQLDKFRTPVWQYCEKQHGLTQTPTDDKVLNSQTGSQNSSNDVRFIVIGMEIHFNQTENDLMTLSIMLKSPHSIEFRSQVEDWMQLLKELEKMLDLFEKYQQIWALLTKVLNEPSFSVRRVDLLERFQPVDETFKNIIHSIANDPHVLNLVHSKTTNDKFHGNSLCQILIDGLSTMEAIYNQMVDLRDALSELFPRLWFLTDREVIKLLSFHPTPSTLLPFVRKFFKGVRWLEVDCKMPSDTIDSKSCGATSVSHGQMKVLGVSGSLQEQITFLSPLEPNLNPLVWLCAFEKQFKLTMAQLLKKCADVHNQLDSSNQDLACDNKVGDILFHIANRRKDAQPVLDMLSEYPLQCVLVAEEAVWFSVVRQVFNESSPMKLNNVKEYNCAKLKKLGQSIRGRVTGSKSESLVSKYMMMCLHALVQLTMNHAQQLSRLMEVECELESSFEWLSLMKYCITSDDQSVRSNDDSTCYVDVLDHRLQYDNEYFGPEDWAMVHSPSTDRAIIGILLALTSYRCGFMSGPCMSGKKKTVVHLGKALGRQIVIIHCYPNLRPNVVQQMVFGALQTGAWLLLDSVDLLTQGIQSSLGQYLEDIYQSFSELLRKKNQTVKEELKDGTADGIKGCKTIVDPECHMVLAGKSLSARLSYGCVLISSKGYTSDVPQSLRYATRPVALTHPDYRIIAEVMLTSIGFSEAMPLSHRLVSLISLAKDSLYLPDFITEHQSGCLVVLQKIIAASEIHLQQSVRQREISDKAKESAAEQTDLTSPQNVTAGLVENDGEEAEKPSVLRSSHFQIVRGLIEETAVVKAILSVLIPVIHDPKKTSQFYIIFKDTFPIVCQFPLFQQYIDEEEKNRLKEAVTEELERKQFQSDTEIIGRALTLYQTMKFSQAVMLVGHTGSGKTTCFSALAGALSSLAAKAGEYVLENDSMIEESTPQADLTWSYVDTVILFPNAMSHEETFGYFCEKTGWQDGAVAKVLRDSERRECTSSETCMSKKSDQTEIVKWLVMDGEPMGQPGWLDYLTTLCNLEDPYLYLSSGETLMPSQSHLKLLLETTDLSDASPSAVTRCSLVYFTGTDLWKAVWKTEMDSLLCEHKLDQGTLKMWNLLAEDLFSSTLSLLKHNAVHSEGAGASCKSSTYGLQEIMSFSRILRALLQHFGKEVEKSEAATQIDKRDIPLHRTDTSNAETKEGIFLVAYIWGFGGHLHPRHWPQFDVVARQVLFNSRYKLVVPDEETVFEHFFGINSKIFHRKTLLTNSVTLKYRKYTYLLNFMLEANQPVLLAGEPGSGKTTLCKTLLSFDKPHISLPVSPLLNSRDLRAILNSISNQKTCKETMCSMTKQSGLLLFVDDLHEAPCDAFGKMSRALETLRQSISKGGILTFDTSHFKFLSPGTISYMATCCVSELGNHHSHMITSRLSRLFSIFVLPNLTIDGILSIHSPQLKLWLQNMPFIQSVADMVCCIITATKDLYHAVGEKFQANVQRPYVMFSYHDLQKIFRGMRLQQPSIPFTVTIQKNKYAPPSFPPVQTGPAAAVLNIAHLWMHECMRTFSDRLCSEDESKTLQSIIAKVASTHYGIRLVDEPTVTSLAVQILPMDTAGPCKPGLKPHPLQPQILQHMEDVMAELVYCPELSEALNQQHNFKCSSSYQERDLDVLVQQVSTFMDRKEEDQGQEVDNACNITSKYIIHRHRVCQLLHILRALLIPGGHSVLIGSDRGTGRKTSVRLAAYITGYQLMEIHPGNESNLHNILREAGYQTRVDGVNVIILVHEEISLAVREEILVSMAHSTYPGLYTEEELMNLVSRVTAVKNSKRYLMDTWTFEKYLSQMYRNVHVFLLMPFTMPDSSEIPANNGTTPWNVQMTKALNLSCCVEVYQPWSNQSLVEVASQCLKTSPPKVMREGSEASLSVAMAGIHQSACQYASVLLRAQPFSPQTYMEFIAHFGYLCNHLHKQWQDQANRVTAVMTHLDVVNNTAVNYKQNLIRLQEKVHETQQLEKAIRRDVDDHKSLLEEAQQRCVEDENALCDLEDQISQIQKQIKPVFQSGLKIVKCLNPSDLEEVRHYRDPPDGVVKVMDAICLLFNRPPGWESAKQLLGQSNFFEELEFFDRCRLTNEQLQQLEQIIQSPLFVPETVREVSKACESLCRWVQAVYEWSCIQYHLFVKQQLEVLAGKARDKLHLAKRQKGNAYHYLEEVKFELQCVQEALEEQCLQLHRAESLERVAAKVARLLERHVKYWRAAAQEVELMNQTLPGDALILAGIISYLGPFSPDIRTELLSKWRELCQTGSININPKDPRASLFTYSDTAPPYPTLGFPIPVSERLQLPLGQALCMNKWQLQKTTSARLVSKLLLWGCTSTWVQRWPLLADTQHHLEISCQNCLITGENAKLEMELECRMVVCADDPKLLDKLDQAAEEGLRVLVTHVERAIPSPQFMARLARPAGCHLPGLKPHVQQTHPNFCLFLSTDLPVRLLSSVIPPSILAQVCVVDLSVGSEEIQELMLTQLLQSECKDLLIRHLQLQNDKQVLQKKMVAEEDALMDDMLQCNTTVLQVSDLLPRVTVCQEAMKTIQAEIQCLSEELKYHESLLAAPRQLMRLAAALYQALQEVSRLSPAYYFSLSGFIAVLHKAVIVKGRPFVSLTIGKEPKAIIPEIMNRMVEQLLVQYRPRLFKDHVAVLKMLVSVALLQHNHLCSEAERAMFFKGLIDIQSPVTKVNPCSPPVTVSQSCDALPTWISPHIYPQLLCLERIPAFRGLTDSLATSPMQWQEYLHFPSSNIVGTVPCRSHSHLSLLQRALLWKTMIPNCLEDLAEAMATYHLCLSGQTAGTEAPHTGNPEALFRLCDKHEGPIILTLASPCRHEWTSVQPLHLIKQMAHCVAETKEVQVKVISFGGLCDKEFILSTLNKAANNGHWLVFNNCHLLDQWDDKVLMHLNQLISSFKAMPYIKSQIHPCFRLWFITEENASSSVPAAVRMCALPLVCDSAWDVKEELSCSLRQVVTTVQRQSLSGVTADDMELLLRSAVFHTVLLQRQTYKYLGKGRIHCWSQEDLQALVDAHICIASLCHNKTKALQYIAVNLVHGGHVLDSTDLEVVESVAKTCLSTAAPLSDSGPHILSNIISSTGHFDMSELLQVLEHDPWDSANISDRLVLGFSADVAAEMKKINNHNMSILLQASQTLGTRCFSTDLNQPVTLPAYSHTRDRLQALQSYLKHQNDSRITNAGTAPHNPLRDFLQAEWDDLIDLVSSLLSQLQQPVQNGTSTFASLLKLPDLSRLERRAELLRAYLWQYNTADPPGAYRLSAFKNAKGVLVALMREAAHVNRQYISDIALHFQVLSDCTYPASLPTDSVYLCGLELKGASWDTQTEVLQDTHSPQPYSLPLVCVKAQVKKTDSSNLRDTSNVQVSDASPSTAPQLPVYHCPLYLDEEEETGIWGLTEANVITTLPLHTKLNPVLCSLRRVRLVSRLGANQPATNCCDASGRC
ncbi:dynein heavy chain domain-containing protein 1-like [Scomber japonicus]|uniref:dynein heavy chain domain-containing protein 1-like n=1 Tax=Scomber japonicus TaxID=13676 RepID=UPI0023066916|nr:dynein heavy chain domain-containing protein 1-like [Scomber japonicus]